MQKDSDGMNMLMHAAAGGDHAPPTGPVMGNTAKRKLNAKSCNALAIDTGVRDTHDEIDIVGPGFRVTKFFTHEES